ncbi:glycosyltransferase 61 family protein [Cyanobacterium aponinum UTEX 3221]|uniref:glycosyltransferase 61 family protein n=1 Tax=Cyanobacterium aponinum TaxID=379064 RepID=UPI002B4C05D6|nr:glycosyltransferase 61 family protein [Cyanobacterium aponinum]WRL38180.1 glycosyltransferase 61 family protein [Cyanobacterium aponinum UTEX 3221]
MLSENNVYIIEDLLTEEKYFLAKKYIENLLETNQENYLLKNYLAITYLCLEENDLSAAIYLELLLDIDELEIDSITETIFKIAQLKYSQHNFNLAIELYYQGLELNPNYVGAYIDLAHIFAQQSNIDLGIEVLKKLLENQPNCIISYENLGKLWEDIKEWKNAIAVYEQSKKIEPQNLQILSSLANCYLQIDDFNSARNILKEIIKINPHHIQSYGQLGYVYLMEKKLNLVVDTWKILINQIPKIINDYQNWYQQEIVIKVNKEEVIKLNIDLIDSLQTNKSLGEISQNIGHILFKQGKYKLAIYYYQVSLEHKVENDTIYTNLIVSLFYQNQYDNINIYLEKLKVINPHQYQIITQQINSNLDNRKEDEYQINNPVNQYYETAYEWAKQNNRLETNYYPFELDNYLYLKPPKTIHKQNHPSFYFPEKIELPKPFLVKIPNGKVYLKKTEGSSAIITENNYLIGDLSPESPALSPNHPDSHASKHSLLKSTFLPTKTTIKGKVLVLAGLLNNVYFHWLFDILPRLYLVELLGINWQDIDYILVDYRTNFQKETLQIFNIPPEKILPLSFPLYLQAEELIIPSFPGCIAWMPSWSCQYLKNKLLGYNKEQKPHKKLYITRNNAHSRRLINEQELIKLLKKKEFEIVDLESFSVKQQAELLSQAKIIISPHGSGLSNLVFCQPNTKVVEIFAPNYVYPCYWLVSNLVDLDYHYIIGETIGSFHFHSFLYPDSRLEDIYLENPKAILDLILL